MGRGRLDNVDGWMDEWVDGMRLLYLWKHDFTCDFMTREVGE